MYENDSIDGTDRVLREFQRRNSRVRILSSDSFSSPSPTSQFGIWDKKRFDAMAKARDVYLRKTLESYSDYDYLVVVDMHATLSWNLEAFLESVVRTSCSSCSWDVMCANGMYSENKRYYDGLAYRPLGFQEPLSEWLKMMHTVISSTFDSSQDPMFQVQSCFGGMAIYKIRTLLKAGCSYLNVSSSSSSSEDCEHIRLHRCLQEKVGANVILNTALELYR